jgi:hypothetical protein
MQKRYSLEELAFLFLLAANDGVSRMVFMSMFTEINDVTGFANGDMWETPAQVLEYFTIKNLHFMVGRASFLTDAGDDLTPSQATLDGWAALVIEQQWHCRF